MTAKYLVATILVVLLGLLGVWAFSMRTPMVTQALARQSNAGEVNSLKLISQRKLAYVTNLGGAAQDSFENKFAKEVENISRVDNDLTLAESHLDELADSMNSADIDKLGSIAHSPESNGDWRSMAIELLARTQSVQALQALSAFVASYQGRPSANWSRNQEFEMVLRAQAIEGIAAYRDRKSALAYVSNLTEKVDDLFLRDRLIRTRENLLDRAPTTVQQDQKALQLLLE